MKKRQLLLAVAAAGLVASVVAGRERPAADIAEPAARIDTRIRAADALDLSKLARPADAGATKDLFANGEFSAGPSEAKSSREKAGPPALPFTYIGKLIEDGKLAVFLSRGGESLSVKPGDTIAGEYRVDAISESEITFTYLPLKAKQRLPL
jgi:hypothetical protein